jgi:hypothetical protein
MGELFSYLVIALRICMVIGGIFAVVALFRGRKVRMSSRELKAAWAIVGLTVLCLLIIIAITLAA